MIKKSLVCLTCTSIIFYIKKRSLHADQPEEVRNTYYPLGLARNLASIIYGFFCRFPIKHHQKFKKLNRNKVSKLDKKNILYQCANFLGPGMIPLTSSGYFCLIFFIFSLYFSYSFTYAFIFTEDLVLAEERTTEKDRKRIMEGKSLSFLQ